MHQHGGYLGRVNVPGLESLNNDISRLPLIIPCNFFRRHCPGAGDFAIEIIPLCRAESGNPFPRLREGGRPLAMGMDDAAQSGERFIQGKMRIRIAGGLPPALHQPSVQIHYHHVLDGHTVIFHPGRLDDHQAFVPVNAGHIAPGKGDQVVFR